MSGLGCNPPIFCMYGLHLEMRPIAGIFFTSGIPTSWYTCGLVFYSNFMLSTFQATHRSNPFHLKWIPLLQVQFHLRPLQSWRFNSLRQSPYLWIHHRPKVKHPIPQSWRSRRSQCIVRPRRPLTSTVQWTPTSLASRVKWGHPTSPLIRFVFQHYFHGLIEFVGNWNI